MSIFNFNGMPASPVLSSADDINDVEGFLSRLRFDEDEVLSFSPSERYYQYDQILEAFGEYLSGLDAVHILDAHIREGSLPFEHPCVGAYFPDGGNLGSFDACACPKSKVDEVLLLYAREREARHEKHDRRRVVSKGAIIAAFSVVSGERKNLDWWDERMRDAERYGLNSARMTRGRGRRPPTFDFLLVAAWLVDRKHLSRTDVVRCLTRSFSNAISEEDLEFLEPPA